MAYSANNVKFRTASKSLTPFSRKGSFGLPFCEHGQREYPLPIFSRDGSFGLRLYEHRENEYIFPEFSRKGSFGLPFCEHCRRGKF